MMRFKNNSYKRYYIISLLALLAFVIMLICNQLDKKVYKVYIEDKLVGITADSPEEIERTYNEVKARKYAQGEDIIKEELTITQEWLMDEGDLITSEGLMKEGELYNKLYAELEGEKTIPVFSVLHGRTFTRSIPFETIYVEDAALFVGESRVIQEGQAGVQEITAHKSVGTDGKELEHISNSTVQQEARPEIIAVGVKEKPEYILPVEEYVFTSPFGPRWGTNHNGVDLAVPTGTDVAATADGVVVQSGWNGGYGISVYVDHGDGVVSRYGHMSQAYAQVGQSVKQGDCLGLSGNTGNSTGPHVHFEIRVGDEAVDPAGYVEIEY